MFELEDSAWDVDESAQLKRLNSELFSSPQKTKKANLKKKKVSLPESDDEIFSKKDKRKIKQRKRKQKKLTDKSNGEVDDDEALELEDESPKSAKKKSKDQNKNVIKNTNLTEKNDNKANVKKRKRKESENVNDENEENPKKFKLTDTDSSLVEDVKTPEKKRRKKKKKNNCKPNKYKHLAIDKEQKCDDSKEASQVDETSSSDAENSKGRFVKALPLEPMSETEEVKKKSPRKRLSEIWIDLDSSQNNNEDEVIDKKLNIIENNDLESKSPEKKKKSKKKKTQINESSSVSSSTDQKTNTQQDLVLNSGETSKIDEDVGEAHKNKKENNGLQNTSSEKKKKKKSKKKKKQNNESSSGSSLQSQETNTQKVNSSLDKSKKDIKVTNAESAKKKKELHKKEIITKMLNDSLLASETLKNVESPKNQFDKNNSKKNSKSLNTQDEEDPNSTNKVQSQSSPVSSIWGKSSILAKEKLEAARFRFINEQLYKCEGGDAMKMFKGDKQAFHVYHEGYRTQVSKWEVNPLDVIIKQLLNKPKSLIIADFGCGEAKLAESVEQKVHSFDLVAVNKRVTACDMSRTPLSPESVDVAVFCLSLMGTNLVDYIREANRVLKTDGLLKIAEVTSRFSGVTSFVAAVCDQGFQILNKRELTSMFYMMDFKKVKSVKKSNAVIKLNPCVYKKR